jgi:hypothetical protein
MSTVLIIGASRGIGLETVKACDQSRPFDTRDGAVSDRNTLARSQA